MRSTVVFATIRIERIGKSGPENERKIAKYLDSIHDGDRVFSNPKDKGMEISIASPGAELIDEIADAPWGHPYVTYTETI